MAKIGVLCGSMQKGSLFWGGDKREMFWSPVLGEWHSEVPGNTSLEQGRVEIVTFAKSICEESRVGSSTTAPL